MNTTIVKGKEWSAIVPVYQEKSNFSLWRSVRTNGTILQFWQEFEDWKATGGDTEDNFVKSIYAKCAPGTDQSVDLAGVTVTYKIINGGGSVIATPQVYTTLQDVDGSTIDLLANGRIGLSLTQTQVDSLPNGNYLGIATFTDGTLTRNAETDTITIKAV